MKFHINKLQVIVSIFLGVILVGAGAVLFRNIPTAHDNQIAATIIGATSPQKGRRDMTDVVEQVRNHSDRLRELGARIKKSELSGADVQKDTDDIKIFAKERKKSVLELMKNNPRQFLISAMRENDRSALPKTIQDDIEKETSITGKTEVRHYDDFTHPENSRFSYILKTTTGDVELFPPEDVHLISGATVKASGYLLDTVLVSYAGSASVLTVVPASTPDALL